MSSPKNSSVSDSGPIIHLLEVGALPVFLVFKEVLIPPEVSNETSQHKARIMNLRLVQLRASAKDLARIGVTEYRIGLGEAEAIALALQEKIDLFLTDDLAARGVAKAYGLEPHGSLGIILRAFREGKLSKEVAVEKVALLYEHSSLFITKDLVNWIIREIEGYHK